ncbi:von Willebrand factor A domain-containing protein DDB_G0292028 [Folsomia candida]|uniref:von Willebrand factor A domain-containing protein DDB_G0292028 n=1 Tax=Folsomia candida TaxID=158441 RepID=UPI001604AF81|nr:von Willebrand factor A domain-containing protein DDB_G0292028 [Folsomia candida]
MTHLLTKRSQYNIHNQRSLTYLFAYTKREILHGTKISASYIKMKSSTEIKQFLDLKNECKFEFIFIHQRAGCTTRQTFNLSKEILKEVLSHLPPNSTFNIIGYGSTFEKLFESSVPKNEENLEKAKQHIESMQLNLGGLNLFNPLNAIKKTPTQSGVLTQVFNLGHAEPQSLDGVMNMIMRPNTRWTFVSLAIDPGDGLSDSWDSWAANKNALSEILGEINHYKLAEVNFN